VLVALPRPTAAEYCFVIKCSTAFAIKANKDLRAVRRGQEARPLSTSDLGQLGCACGAAAADGSGGGGAAGRGACEIAEQYTRARVTEAHLSRKNKGQVGSGK
jgi:hypothetical protein